MSELDANTQKIPEEWLRIPEIKQAVHLAEEAAYTPNELAAYEKYWDAVSTEKTLITGFYEDGLEKGRAEGRAEERAESRKKMRQIQLQIARSLKQAGLSDSAIADHTHLSLEELTEIL